MAEACSIRCFLCKRCGAEFQIKRIQKAKCCPVCGSKKWDALTQEDKDIARVKDVHPWIMEKTKGGKVYHYWMASWRQDGKVRHVHLGSTKKITDYEIALHVAMSKKAAALGIEWV